MSGRATSLLILVVGGVLLATGLTLTGLAASAGLELNPYVVTNPVIGVGFLIPAAVIGRHRPRNPLVAVLAVGAAGHLLAGIGVAGWTWGRFTDWPDAAVDLCFALMGVAWKFGLGPPFALLLLMFPDGRLPSPRWWWLVWATLGALLFGIVGWVVAPDDLALNIGIQLADLVVVVAAVVSLVLRYRRGDEAVRGQILWMVLAVLVMLAVNLERAVTGRGPELLLLSFVCVPVAIAIAVLRHRLLDIRFVVSRAVLYGALVALVLTAYVGLVAAAAALLPADLRLWGPVTSAVVVALLLNPVRIALTRLVTRAFYGHRGDPGALLSRGWGDADDLAEVLDQARRALRLPGLAVTSGDGAEIAAVGAAGSSAARVSIPLTSRGETLGVLLVALRPGESRLHRQDDAALGPLTGSLALLLRERALAEALRLSRAQLVRARESERSLLHRDLHDGLGPTLTNAAFRADAASNRLVDDPSAASVLLAEARAGIREALGDVRRVVYGLRPLALEQRGLVGAIGERVGEGARLPVVLDAAADLPILPPAVELAAYRIATEAVTNAQRHSRGTEIDVRVDLDGDDLLVVVGDDGPVNGEPVPGAGLRSISERAEELGGRSEVSAGPAGFRVTAWLPFRA